MISKKVIIKGQVQGVFFRSSAKDKADEYGLGGEVRNMPDGSVEVVVSGPEDQIQRLIEWCHDGPVRAEVSEVNVSDLPEREFEGFRVISG
jgi:acylphosphatase